MSNKTDTTQKAVSDKLSEKEATSLRLLVEEDIAKLRLSILRLEGQRASFDNQIALLNTRIGEGNVALADIARRVAGVVYPEEPEKKAPLMKAGVLQGPSNLQAEEPSNQQGPDSVA